MLIMNEGSEPESITVEVFEGGEEEQTCFFCYDDVSPDDLRAAIERAGRLVLCDYHYPRFKAMFVDPYPDP